MRPRSRRTCVAGDFAITPPGHDAWTLGDEPCVVIDWQGFADYAQALLTRRTGCSSRPSNYRENQSDSKAQASAVVNRAYDGRLNRAAASRPRVVPAMTNASEAPTPTGVSWVPTA